MAIEGFRRWARGVLGFSILGAVIPMLLVLGVLVIGVVLLAVSGEDLRLGGFLQALLGVGVFGAASGALFAMALTALGRGRTARDVPFLAAALAGALTAVIAPFGFLYLVIGPPAAGFSFLELLAIHLTNAPPMALLGGALGCGINLIARRPWLQLGKGEGFRLLDDPDDGEFEPVGAITGPGGRSLLLAVVALSAACTGADSPAVSQRTVVDSAGVQIITTALPQAALWTVDSVPMTQIGSRSGENGQDLGLAWASRRLSDGRVAISNASTNELRIYGPGGDLLQTLGGRGEGPGEFLLVAAVLRIRGDTLIVADASQPRLNVYSTDGEVSFETSIPIEPVDGRLPRLRGIAGDSMAVFRVEYFMRSGGVSRAVRDTFEISARSLSGGPTVRIGRFLADEHFNQVTASGGIAAWNLPFARDFHNALSSELFWVGVSDDFELRGFDPATGALERIIRVPGFPIEVTGDDTERFRQNQLAGAESPDQAGMYAELHRIVEYAPSFPAFSGMEEDPQGNVWVQRYTPPWDESGVQTWDVFSPDGEPLSRVDLPADLVIQDIAEDAITVRWIDELGAEFIRVYGLNRGD